MNSKKLNSKLVEQNSTNDDIEVIEQEVEREVEIVAELDQEVEQEDYLSKRKH